MVAYSVRALLLTLFGSCALAYGNAVRAPEITAAPLVGRAVTTVGFQSTGMSQGSTLWNTITLNGDSLIIATSGSIYRLCNPTVSACDFFSCRGSYAVFPTTSYLCNSASTCSSYVLVTDAYDSSPLTNYWCDDKTETGGTIYRTKPGVSLTPSARPTPSDPTGPSSPGGIAAPTTPTSPSKVPTEPKSSPPIGAIVGGVIGGLAVLGAVVVAVVFLLRRKHNKQPGAAPVQHHQAPPEGQQVMPAGQTYYSADKPVGVVSHNPAGPYYGGSGPASPVPASPVPQYSPPVAPMANYAPPVNELPAQRY